MSRWNLSIDGRACIVWCWERIGPIVIGLGIAARLYLYQQNRSFWLDESSLYHNIAKTPIFPLWAPLKNTQLAPVGFLAVERFIAQTCGASRVSLRFLPLAAGIASIFLFDQVAKRILNPKGATVGLALFALSYDPLYYAVELKQYSSDVAVSLACLLSSLLIIERQTSRRFQCLAALATLAPWFSHPAVFTIAGVGITLLISQVLDRKWVEFKFTTLIGTLAILNCWGSYLASVRLLGNPRGMNVFWSIYFLKIPPKDFDEWNQLARQLRELLTNPLEWLWPVETNGSVALFVALLAFGIYRLAVEKPRVLLMLSLPILLTMAASSERMYPFHGRLILFLLPTFEILLVYGTSRAGMRFGREWLERVLYAVVLVYPLSHSAYLVATLNDRDFSPVGDLHPSPFAKTSTSQPMRPQSGP